MALHLGGRRAYLQNHYCVSILMGLYMEVLYSEFYGIKFFSLSEFRVTVAPIDHLWSYDRRLSTYDLGSVGHTQVD